MQLIWTFERWEWERVDKKWLMVWNWIWNIDLKWMEAVNYIVYKVYPAHNILSKWLFAPTTPSPPCKHRKVALGTNTLLKSPISKWLRKSWDLKSMMEMIELKESSSLINQKWTSEKLPKNIKHKTNTSLKSIPLPPTIKPIKSILKSSASNLCLTLDLIVV